MCKKVVRFFNYRLHRQRVQVGFGRRQRHQETPLYARPRSTDGWSVSRRMSLEGYHRDWQLRFPRKRRTHPLGRLFLHPPHGNERSARQTTGPSTWRSNPPKADFSLWPLPLRWVRPARETLSCMDLATWDDVEVATKRARLPMETYVLLWVHPLPSQVTVPARHRGFRPGLHRS